MLSPIDQVVICMNVLCGISMTHRWIKVWPLKAGGFAKLCHACGTAYENSNFCETYHKEEQGWRKCLTCEKSIHCGCIASKHIHKYMDYGGIQCNSCKEMQTQDLVSDASSTNSAQPCHIIATNSGNTAIDTGKMVSSQDLYHPSPIRKVTQEENASNVKATVNAGQSSTIAPLLTSTQPRAHLLAKKLPKISGAELQKMFGALNTTITPLFQKVLSATDAGNTDRLILPKVCAEAYLPPLSESAGVPLQLLDANGKEWTFQLRFWMNFNVRLYVFQGARRYIREMGLQAGDTVIFGRIHDGKLVLGFQKKDGTLNTKDNQPSEVEVMCHQAHKLMQPKPNSKCNIVMIEDWEFEEYDEPPIIGDGDECSTQVPGSSHSLPLKRLPNELQSPPSPDLKKLKILESQIGSQEQTSSAMNTLDIVAYTGETNSETEPQAETLCANKQKCDFALESNGHTSSA